MGKSKIYIAASERARTLAEKLRENLNTEFCEARCWKDEREHNPGKTKIEILEEAANNYDFAVVLLTKDDVTGGGTGDILKVRDDCIFEAGLFMAAIGRKRCFLVSGVDTTDLPSDLGGIPPFAFHEPADVKDRISCGNAIQDVSGQIKDEVQKVGRVGKGNRPLTQQRLLERERHTSQGGELKEDQVVVASVQPLEVDYQAARQVRSNIERNIKYVYFFEGTRDGAEKTCKLLQMVLLADDSEERWDPENFKVRGDKVRANADRIVRNLKWICANDYIKIYFLPGPPDVQYCIHNAGDVNLATLYVKHRDEFIEWESGWGARQFWIQAMNKRGVERSQPKHAVFYGAPGFDLRGFGPLEWLVEKYFPDIGKQVLELCVAGLPEKGTQSHLAGAIGSTSSPDGG